MPVLQKNSPDLVPVLSAGRHRNPRKGACFMEFASYLAGERWSDHPACTLPALAFLARMVNDCTSDRERSRLAELIPSVIGMTTSDPRAELLIALRAATAALPIASEERQRALAVGILGTQAKLAEFEAPGDPDLLARISAAFAQAPFAERWARDFVSENRIDPRQRAIARMTESIIRTSVLGIAQACSPGANERLRELLKGAIEDCRKIVAEGMTQANPVPPNSVPPNSIEDGFPRAGALQLEESVK
ncbi:MAG: hypothetical protein ABIW81_04395 [Terrimesophilobacter sp.]